MTTKIPSVEPAAVQREGSDCLKFDGRQAKFGRSDVVPLWVADMDFAAPKAVTEALIRRAEHPTYGYGMAPETLYDAVQDWMSTHHGWHVKREWLLLCSGVTAGLYAAITSLTVKTDGIIVQPPVYPPFHELVWRSERRKVDNPLCRVDGRYEMDLAHMATCAQEASMLLLCSPHNPVGRVWRPEELEAVLAIAETNNLVVVSDEVHCDVVYRGHRHRPLGLLVDGRVPTIVAISGAKTFGIAGLGLAVLVIPDREVRTKISAALAVQDSSAPNPFALVAMETAYREGEAWRRTLVSYLETTRDEVTSFIANKVPKVRVVSPEATFLLWLDCRGLGLDDEKLQEFLVEQVGLGLSPGKPFGTGGSGFVRLNIASPRDIIMDACERFERALS